MEALIKQGDGLGVVSGGTILVLAVGCALLVWIAVGIALGTAGLLRADVRPLQVMAERGGEDVGGGALIVQVASRVVVHGRVAERERSGRTNDNAHALCTHTGKSRCV